ncbi:hypothetical protein L5F07_09985 [Aliarcobacter butzleri]|uniref:hypothetical protein n=1 Tax=Aliarcobacter butzleri TaxID=28197 RepID=UPI001EDA653E|nr:hypothetical protein [Aliarcobacter butzleri]MCG3679587.1 hypothetical protein [Aliarcobacter butzleri]
MRFIKFVNYNYKTKDKKLFDTSNENLEESNINLENYYINKLDNEVEFKHKHKDLTIKDKEKQ